MAIRFGINGGDAGDQFMDAPPAGSGGGSSRGGGSGENPLSSFLNLVGVHIGENKSAKDAIEKGAAQGTDVKPVSQGDSNVVNLNPDAPVSDSQGDVINPNGLAVAPGTQKIDVPDLAPVPPPSKMSSFLHDVGASIGLAGSDSGSPGDPQVNGNKDGSYGGGLVKTLMKFIGI